MLTNPEKTEKLSGQFLGLFHWVGTAVRRRGAKSLIEGQVNVFARRQNSEVEGAMPYNMRLDFVTDVDKAELASDRQTVIVRTRDRSQNDHNLVHAMLAFAPIGVVPQARRYLGQPMSEAIDFTITRKLLTSLRHHSALTYLDDEALPPSCELTEGLDDYCRIFDRLDEYGLFSPVVLAELKDYGASVESRQPDPAHLKEAEDFVRYVSDTTRRTAGQPIGMGYIGRYIAASFVFIGSGEAISTRGATPYLRHLRRLQDHGYAKAYLAARGGEMRRPSSMSLDMAGRVADLAEAGGFASVGRRMMYYCPDGQGINRQHVLIELSILPPSSRVSSLTRRKPRRKPRRLPA